MNVDSGCFCLPPIPNGSTHTSLVFSSKEFFIGQINQLLRLIILLSMCFVVYITCVSPRGRVFINLVCIVNLIVFQYYFN